MRTTISAMAMVSSYLDCLLHVFALDLVLLQTRLRIILQSRHGAGPVLQFERYARRVGGSHAGRDGGIRGVCIAMSNKLNRGVCVAMSNKVNIARGCNLGGQAGVNFCSLRSR